MADDAQITEDIIFKTRIEINSILYARAAMTTKVKSFLDFSVFF